MKKLLSALIITLMLFTCMGQTFGAASAKTYSNKKLGWSISLPTDLSKDTSSDKYYEENYKDKNNTKSLSIYMYSLSGLTLESWVAKELKEYKENYNKTYFNVIKTEDGKLGKNKIKKIYFKYLGDDIWYNVCSIYMVGKNYRYLISYSMKSDDYKVAAKKKAMDNILTSFKFTEPSVKTLGTLVEASNNTDSKKHIKIENKNNGCSYEIPDTWKKVLDTDSMAIYQCNNYELTLMLSVDQNPDNKSLDDCSKDYENQLKDNFKCTIKSKKTINANGNEFTAYSMAGSGTNITAYITIMNGKIYGLALVTAKFVDIPKNNKVMNDIWKSFKITDTGTGNSIIDYTSLLKGNLKDKVGDSFYNWSFSTIKNLSVTERSFDGSITKFSTDDSKCILQIFITKNTKNANLDTISASMLDYVKDSYTVIDSGIQKNGDQEYAVIAYRGDKDNFVNEHRVILANDLVYQIVLSVEQEDYNNKTYSNLLDSFKTVYLKDGSMNDLSDVNSNGMRTYKSRSFYWTIDVMPDWSESKAENKGNSVSFIMDENNYAFVEMYSLDDGMTLDKLIQDEYNYKNLVYNKQLVTVSSPEDMVINGVKCKSINVSYNYNGKIIHDKLIYTVGRNYKYILGYTLEDAEYNDTAVKSKFDNVISSFSFTEPDFSKVGKLFDPDSSRNSTSTKQISSSNYNWAVTLPTTFTADEDNNDEDYASYSDNNRYLYFCNDVYKAEKTLDNYVADEVQKINTNTSKYTYYGTETLNEKGTVVKKITYKYTYPYGDYSYSSNNTEYILVKNGNVYYIYLEVSDIRNSDYSNQILKAIWDSMTF